MTNEEYVRDFLERNEFPEGTPKSEIARAILKERGIEYTETRRRKYLNYINAARSELASTCEEVGIDPSTVTNYWYKGKHFSIHAKGGEKLNMEEIVENIVEKVKAHAPMYDYPDPGISKDGHLLVVDLADCHIGKLSRAYESGSEYDIEIAKARVLEGFNGIMAKSAAFNVERVMIVIGNDQLHYDNPHYTTTKGTKQDPSGMFFDMFNHALEAYVTVVESALHRANVDIVFNPSNHDLMSGWMLARTLEAWFHNCDRVTFDTSMRHRKYYKYGKNLIATSHGDGAKEADMPMLIAHEAPELWATTTFRYCYMHHIHHKKQVKFQSGKDYIGLTVEYMRSPSEADSYHSRNGYVGAKKAIEGFLHHPDYGQVCRLSHYFE